MKRLLDKGIIIKKDFANKKFILTFVSYVMIIITSYIFVNASRWSFYSADDFSHAVGVGVFGKNIIELFKASIAYMIHMYKNWQGTYFSMFLQSFLSPLNSGETVRKLG